MVELILEKDQSVIICGDENIFTWKHRLFFQSTLGFNHLQTENKYKLEKPVDLYGCISDVIGYLQEEEIEYSTDDSVKQLLMELEKGQEEFRKAEKLGLQAKRTTERVNNPKGFTRILKDYQLRALKHLMDVRYGANFSVPGSGKTSVVYAAFHLLKSTNEIDKLFVIGPRSSFAPWEEEARQCFENKPTITRLSGDISNRLLTLLRVSDVDVFLSTYQTVSNDIEKLIPIFKQYRVFLVIDESHNIKRMEGGVWAEACIRISPYASRRAILTGTPIPNDFYDLWSQFTFLWPQKQVLGDRLEYKSLCEEKNQSQKIKKCIIPFYFRVTKTELKLPKPIYKRYRCRLNPYQSQIYRALAVRFIQELEYARPEKQYLRQWRKARMVRLLQATSNPTLLAKYSAEFRVPPITEEGFSIINVIEKYPEYEIPAKFEIANKLIRSIISKSEKVVVWTSFIHNIFMLKNILKDLKIFVVYGDVPKDSSEDIEFNREQQISDFKNNKEASILLANPAACAESISLHSVCRNAVYLDRTFNCGQYLQSLDRIHRLGLKKNEKVIYHLIEAIDTIDETIENRLNEKIDRMKSIFSDELPLGSFETEDYEFDQEQEEKIDFDATIKDLKRMLSKKAIK